MKRTEQNWVVWFRYGNGWFALPFTARTTRAASINAWQEWMESVLEWNRQRRAGDVRCIRTKFTAEVPDYDEWARYEERSYRRHDE